MLSIADEKKALIYSAISFFTGLSIVLWPISHLFEFEPLSGLSLAEQWPLYVGAVLIVVTVVDSIVPGLPSAPQSLSHIAWIVVMSLVVFRLMEFPNAIFLLGMLWFVHSFRSLPLLWLGVNGWWLWAAWVRDCSMAIILFVWSNRIWIVV